MEVGPSRICLGKAADDEFIIAARAALPLLIAEVRRLQQECAHLETLYDNCMEQSEIE